MPMNTKSEARAELTAMLAEGNPVAVQIEVPPKGAARRVRLFVAENGVIRNITSLVGNATGELVKLPSGGAGRYIAINTYQLEARTDAIKVYVEHLLSPYAPSGAIRSNLI
jgi:hypothetical protein